MTFPAVNVADARGLSFACQPGCGFCCTATPLVLEHEAGPLGALVTRAADGSLRIPIRGLACSALASDKSCGVYEDRPAVCHLYPFQVHAGRRIQVTVSWGCPGVSSKDLGEHEPVEIAVHPVDDMDEMSRGAQEAARRALAQPGAAAMAGRARKTFGEFDRRMREWGAGATPDRLRSGFIPHLDKLARPEMLPSFFSGIASGELLLDGSASRAVEQTFAADFDVDLDTLLAEAARDAFDEPGTVLWVEPDLAWTTARVAGDKVRLGRERDGKRVPHVDLDLSAIPTAWEPDASEALAGYIERLTHRDHTEGAAAWLVDASGYQASLPAAYGRVLGEAALQVMLRAGLFALESGVSTVTPGLARRGVRAYETSFHSLPTLGSVL